MISSLSAFNELKEYLTNISTDRLFKICGIMSHCDFWAYNSEDVQELTDIAINNILPTVIYIFVKMVYDFCMHNTKTGITLILNYVSIIIKQSPDNFQKENNPIQLRHFKPFL